MRSLFNSLAVIGCLASGAASAAVTQCGGVAGNLVQNCGFEVNDGTVASGVANWTIGNGTSTVASQIPQSTFGPDIFGANTGAQGYSLSSNGGTLILSQALALPFSSGNYQVTFFLDQSLAENPSPQPPNLDSISASLGGVTGVSMTNFGLTNPAAGQSQFEELTFLVSDLSSASNILAFAGRDDAGFLDIDDVSVTYVPEPGTLLMFGAGIVGLAGLALRRSNLSAARA
jgi:hypothetical protein